jgi:hypothetical protein
MSTKADKKIVIETKTKRLAFLKKETDDSFKSSPS